MNDIIVSVIVPVYNVAPYLEKCLDSIVDQTYRNLEILLIDDGSTDDCGEICDRYARNDSRIKVFHTENRGLSAARNLGLDYVMGGYIGFVDSGDWIDPDTYERLVECALETGADVVECGCYHHYATGTQVIDNESFQKFGKDALIAVVNGEIGYGVWNKLWKTSCFAHIRFPDGHINEDLATTYKIFEIINSACRISQNKYHYRRRSDSLSKNHEMRFLVDYWLANYQRLLRLWKKVDKSTKIALIRGCAASIARTWAYYYYCSQDEKETYDSEIRRMHKFSKSYIPLLGCREWGIQIQIGIFFSHYFNSLSFLMAGLIMKAYARIQRKKMY